MPIKAIFTEGVNELTVSGLHQWDYGQKLEIHGLALPALIEVHFACLNMTEAVPRVGTTVDGVTTVAIPDGCLEHDTPLRAWVYVIDTTSGKTERTIHLPIIARTKPQGAESRQPFAVDEYAEALQTINETVDGWRDGIVDQNDGGKTKVWTGTRAQFNELEETDDHTLYVITDELPDYTDLVEGYAKLIELAADLQEIKDGIVAVPKATKAQKDYDGRNLSAFGYFGDVFQQVQAGVSGMQLPEAGVYQIYVQSYNDDKMYLAPLVSFGGADNLYAKEQVIHLCDSVELRISADGTVSTLPGSVYDKIHVRKVAPFSGWAAG